LFFTGFFVVSCSVEKNTSATRNFHNLTSRYNIYFNANESFKEGLIRAEESFEDDFTSILPLFFYEDESTQQAIMSQMKRAIDKSSKVITFHSITAKPKVKKGRQSDKDKAFYNKTEYNKWVDDCYILIGKSYMYQGKFYLATESFNHVLRNFPEEESYYLALTWLVRAYNVIGALDDSERILITLRDIEDFPGKYEEELYTSLADFHIRKKEYAQAAEYLERALDAGMKKNRRIRYRFILAQLYNLAGEGETSIRNYKRVIRMNPPYVMSFNAKVSMAEAFQSGHSNSAEIIKLLNKMLKDVKNKEFLDQIYYALGNIYLEEGNREKAIEYYHLSVTKSLQNRYQKGQSSLTLAEIYYNESSYSLSAAYYDTAVNLLDSDYPDYNRLNTRSASLNNLVRNINVFELQDSVQRLAVMPESERLAVVDEIIGQIRQQEQEERMREQQEIQDQQFNRLSLYESQSGFGTGNQQTGGKWYFYNLNAKSFGQPEFRMKWGERKLEDNWRRRNRQSTMSLPDEENGVIMEDATTVESQIIDNTSREYYLRNIPLSDSAMAISHTKLEEALYNMAMIYRNDLLDYVMAIESLEELVKRYPDNNYTMASYYYLHDLYNNIQLPARADYYKQLLSRKYPESHMARLLTNPNYIRELEEEERRIERFYEDVFEDYRMERFGEVIRKADQGLGIFAGNSEYTMRLSYLKAISTGAVKGKEAMKAELDSIVLRYPGTEIAREAKGIIDYMYVAFPVIKEADQAREAEQLYHYSTEANHRFLLAVKKSENLNLINFNLLNYNLDNFNIYDLEIRINQVLSDYNLLEVVTFSDFMGASIYAESVRNDILEIMGEISPSLYEIVLISDENYNKLVEVKEFMPYLIFYKQNYLE
jgi:tetratricopeptide (TPR) repeat protein